MYTIDEDNILDPEYYHENKALAILLAEDVCFMNTFNVGTKEQPDWTTVIYVNCNDTFAWGCADAESITNNDGEEGSEIISLYKHWKKDRVYGPTKWVCIKRNMQPQPPLKKYMINDNAWDDELEKLPRNPFDKSE